MCEVCIYFMKMCKENYSRCRGGLKAVNTIIFSTLSVCHSVTDFGSIWVSS